MKIKIEAKEPLSRNAIESAEEARGLTGMPIVDRRHFNCLGKREAVALPPADVIGKPAIVVPENP